LDETKDLGEMLENTLRNIGENVLRTLYEQMFVTPIMNSFMGAMSSAGGTGGILSLFAAKGVVLNGPTIIPSANGNIVAGEDGEEAIMPLKRDKAGRLGVEASGGSGGDPAVTVPVTVMNVPSEEERSCTDV
jgi:phage-related minor tail protein